MLSYLFSNGKEKKKKKSKWALNTINSRIFKYVPFDKFNFWTQDFSSFTVKSIVSACTSSFHFTLCTRNIGLRLAFRTNWCHKSFSQARSWKFEFQWVQRKCKLLVMIVGTTLHIRSTVGHWPCNRLAYLSTEADIQNHARFSHANKEEVKGALLASQSTTYSPDYNYLYICTYTSY